MLAFDLDFIMLLLLHYIDWVHVSTDETIDEMIEIEANPGSGPHRP